MINALNDFLVPLAKFFVANFAKEDGFSLESIKRVAELWSKCGLKNTLADNMPSECESDGCVAVSGLDFANDIFPVLDFLGHSFPSSSNCFQESFILSKATFQVVTTASGTSFPF